MKERLEEALEILKENGYIVETFNTIGDSDDDIDGDKYNGGRIVFYPNPKEYGGTDYKEWIATVRDAVWNCCCGYDFSVDAFNEFMENHKDDIEDAWIVKKWPKQFGRTLFNKYFDEFEQ